MKEPLWIEAYQDLKGLILDNWLTDCNISSHFINTNIIRQVYIYGIGGIAIYTSLFWGAVEGKSPCRRHFIPVRIHRLLVQVSWCPASFHITQFNWGLSMISIKRCSIDNRIVNRPVDKCYLPQLLPTSMITTSLFLAAYLFQTDSRFVLE